MDYSTFHRPPRPQRSTRHIVAVLAICGVVSVCVAGLLATNSSPVELLWVLAAVPADVQAHLDLVNSIPPVPDMPLLSDPKEAPESVQAFWAEREGILGGYHDFLRGKSGIEGAEDQAAAAKAIADVTQKSIQSNEESANSVARAFFFDHEKELNAEISDANSVESQAAAGHAAAAANAAKLAAWAVKINDLTPVVASLLAIKESKEGEAATLKSASDSAAAAVTDKETTLASLQAAVAAATTALSTATTKAAEAQTAYDSSVSVAQAADAAYIAASTASPRDEAQVQSLDTAAKAAASAELTTKQTLDTALSSQSSAASSLSSAQSALSAEQAKSPSLSQLQTISSTAKTAYETAEKAAEAAREEWKQESEKLEGLKTAESVLRADVARIEAQAAMAAAGVKSF